MRSIKELINLQNRTALITGCNSPMGQSISETLAELGSNLICTDNNNKISSKLNNKLKEYDNISFKFISSDFSLIESRVKLIETIRKSTPSIEVLVNSAAMTGSYNGPGWKTNFKNQDIDIWNKALEINITSIFHLCRDLSDLLSITKRGSIINIASIYGLYGPDYSIYQGTKMGNPAAYAVSKGGLIQLTKWLASTMAPSVRVNCISPGGVFDNQEEDFVKKYNSKTKLNRMANYEDFKGVIAYLSSDMSEYVTGQNIVIDGGWGI